MIKWMDYLCLYFVGSRYLNSKNKHGQQQKVSDHYVIKGLINYNARSKMPVLHKIIYGLDIILLNINMNIWNLTKSC